MLITGAASDRDACGEDLSSFVNAMELRQKLAILEIARHVVRVSGEQLAEMLHCSVRIAALRAFQGQPVAGEGIARIRSDEFFEHLPPRFLLLGHAVEPRIICACQGSTKRSKNGVETWPGEHSS